METTKTLEFQALNLPVKTIIAIAEGRASAWVGRMSDREAA
jgi:hypothetical protein